MEDEIKKVIAKAHASEERAQKLARELASARIYIEIEQYKETILRRNQRVYLVIALVCIVALFAIFFGKLIGAT